MKKIYLAKEGRFFSLVLAAVTIAVWKIYLPAGVLMSVLLSFVIFFFRDPQQETPHSNSAFYSPADGKVTGVALVPADPYLGKPFMKVSIFLSIFDVHVNKAAMDGVVKEIRYVPGKFIPANHPKACSVNESNVLIVESLSGLYLMRQIAGLIARRIVCDVKVGSPLSQGRRFGIIQFGSGMELYMPPSAVVQVSVGQKVKAGETVLGVL